MFWFSKAPQWYVHKLPYILNYGVPEACKIPDCSKLHTDTARSELYISPKFTFVIFNKAKPGELLLLLFPFTPKKY